ncbi:UPF0041-domain-containing protein [Piedraia hortae CBS 480.64]|uniref:Mitochondrial pyruvate carrier n=1 Tax=Piedraia hortae CBS 480.64 TaxID=1314780 RepID=A0A6A7BXE3_9PEZI|nr:UPF0041-domain-containing protein [Piedraia hortae CBS 480.64]
MLDSGSGFGDIHLWSHLRRNGPYLALLDVLFANIFFTQWGLVLAGAADFTRPAEQLSLSQNAALMATGAIWTRWCFVIRPQNMFLASVNALLFCVGTTQVARIFLWKREMEAKKQDKGVVAFGQ